MRINKHKFNPKNKDRLEKKERQDFYDIEAALNWFGIEQDSIVADVGAGTGFFTRRLAKLAKKVYAIDISSELLDEIKKNKAGNIEILLAEENKIPIESESVDLVFLSYVVHEFNDLTKSLAEIKRSLKPGGKIGIIEWEKVEMDEGPSYNERIASTEMEGLLENNGIKLLKIKSLAKGHYAILSGRGG
ncbi:class I SAM-dependent methyltransferase [Candidatus Margulisiibacteriota bacterium]